MKRTIAGDKTLKATKEQAAVLKAVQKGESVLIHGPGGTGKSFLIENIALMVSVVILASL